MEDKQNQNQLIDSSAPENINPGQPQSINHFVPPLDTTPGTVIRGGYQASPVDTNEDKFYGPTSPVSTFSPETTYLPDTSILQPTQSRSHLKQYAWAVASIAVILIIITLSLISLASIPKSRSSLASTGAASKHPAVANTPQVPSKVNSTPSTTKTQTPAPITPTVTSSNSVAPSTPQAITLTNQDNGRTLTLPLGGVINVHLAQLPGVTGHQWALLVTTYTNSACPINTYCPGVFGRDNVTHGSDGSISDDNLTALNPGQVNVGFADNPDCFPVCSQQKTLQYWQVTVNVNK